jgi:deoxyribodipyrimidine photo-lyase
MQAKFVGLDWRHAPAQLKAWQRGLTGIPIVDAGMRELWETGYMHNRVRMLVASFLAKNLLIDWREGGDEPDPRRSRRRVPPAAHDRRR